MRRFTLLSGIFIFSLAVVSCGTQKPSDGGDQDQPQAGTNKASTEEVLESQAMQTGDRIYGLIMPPQTVAGTTGMAFPRMPAGFGMMSAKSMDGGSRWNCSGSTGGDLTDADDDYIPVNGIYEFQCSMNNNMCQMDHYGKVNAKDDDDNDPLSGYNVCTGTISGNQCSRKPITMKGSCGNDSGKMERIYDFNLDKNGNVYNFTTFFFEWRFYDSDTATTPVARATIESNNLSFTAQADGDEDIFDNGTWNGQITFSAQGDGGSFQCSINFTNLQISEACAGGAVSGSVRFSCDCPSGPPSSQASLEVSFNSCGSGTYYYTTCDGSSGSGSF